MKNSINSSTPVLLQDQCTCVGDMNRSSKGWHVMKEQEEKRDGLEEKAKGIN